MRWRYKSLFVLIAVVTVGAVLVSNSLLQPAPTQPLGYYDYFGKLLNPQQAEQLVRQSITLKKDLTLSSRTYRRGIAINTGLNEEKGSLFPKACNSM